MSVVLVSFTAALIGSLAYVRARRALEKETRVRLTLSARSIAEHLHRELEDRAADITNWAHLEVMRAVLYEDVDKQLAEFIRQIVRGRQIYRAILCIDSQGRPVASAGEVEAVKSAQRAARTRISIVPVGRDADEPGLQLDTPIILADHPEGSVGTLVVLVDPRYLLKAADATLRAAGAQVSMTLRTRAGEVVLETAGSSQRHAPQTDQTQAVTLTGAAAVGSLPNIDSPELQVVVAEPVEVALAAVTALRATLIRIGIFALLVGSALGALVAWRIARPIRRLTATVRQVTERGQLDPAADFPRASGEVGVLASAFRTMTESLATAQAEAVAQSRLAFLGEVAANIAHEVRTPLSVLKTSAQLLARPDVPFAEQRQLAETAVVEVDRLNRVVSDLVDLARPKPVRYRTESVAEIVERALAFFATTAAKSGVEVVHTVGDGVQPLYCSADQLYQVFLNLIHNALQAMAGSGRLTVRCYGENAWVVVEVDDTGPGISLQVLPKLFSPFCTTKLDGTGLGLAISKRIVEEHGGTIAAENLPGGGAHFQLRLPCNREST